MADAQLPTRPEIVERLERTLTALIDGEMSTQTPDIVVRDRLDAIVASGQHTIRDGMLTLLAMAVESGAPLAWDSVSVQGSPARTASHDLGHDVYPRLGIVGSREALQTGVKGLRTYRDRSTRTGDWEAILDWASRQDTIEAIENAFVYLAAGVAATARRLPALPVLARSKLTFGRTFALLDFLLTQPSRGAYEQFIFAALYESQLRQEGDDRSRVQTKNLNASDASSGTAADVQHLYGGDVREAYEVTGAAWTTKVSQAERSARRHGLDRLHIIGLGGQSMSGDEILASLPDTGPDLAVLEVRDEVRSLVHRLTPEYRRRAIELLYEHLVERQPRDQLVNQLVDELETRELVL